jgi:hypothetical protein
MFYYLDEITSKTAMDPTYLSKNTRALSLGIKSTIYPPLMLTEIMYEVL